MVKLKELRREKGLSQNDFAKAFHASQNTVSQWEGGTRKPSYETAKEIADYFDVSVDYLLGNTSIRKISDELSDAQVAFAGGAFDGLHDEDIEMLADMARILKEKRDKKGD